jgi:hypothetical protein
MTNAAQYVMLNFGHHTLRWHLAQIRANRTTCDLVAAHYAPDENSPARRTISKGLEDLLKAKSKDLPESLR